MSTSTCSASGKSPFNSAEGTELSRRRNFRLRFFEVLALATAFVSGTALGAACCGAGAAVPGLLMDEEQTRLTLSSRFLRLVGVSDDGTLLRDDDWKDDTLLFQLEAAALLSDRWSMGARLGVGRHWLPAGDGNASQAGIGDVTAVLAYEWLPAWNARSPWPRGVAFVALTVPTGAADPANAVPLGRGYWSFVLGTSLAKTLGDFDVFFVPQLGLGIRNERPLAGGAREMLAAAAFGVGWTPPRLPVRLAVRVDPQLRWPSGLAERWVTPIVADLSVLLDDTWRIAVAFEDQTLVPLHRNVSLGRGVGVSLVHRWLR